MNLTVFMHRYTILVKITLTYLGFLNPCSHRTQVAGPMGVLLINKGKTCRGKQRNGLQCLII